MSFYKRSYLPLLTGLFYLGMHTPLHAQEKVIMDDLAPWIKEYHGSDDIALDPELLTVADLKTLKKKSTVAEKKRHTIERDIERNQDHNAIDDTPPSAVEDMYTSRVVDPLKQFGYDLFASENQDKNDDGISSGALQDDFVLNIGDELSVIMRGQRLNQSTYTITGEGLLVVDDLPPINAAGKTIAQLREALKAQVSSIYNTDIYLSLAKVRQVGVLVVGHVKKPGRKSLTTFDTALDALMSSGGIEKTGSLRQIKLIRDGKTQIVDLYGLLIHGNNAVDITIRDGDRIVVPPLGPTIAIAGAVKRPGIYEILPALRGMWHQPEKKSQKLALNDLLDMAGGTLSPAQHRFIKMELTPKGEETVQTALDPFARVFGDGAILSVARGTEKRAGTVELVGHTGQAGIHALDEASTLSALLDNETVLGPDIYPLIAIIERWHKDEMAKQLLPFSPIMVTSGEFDRTLEEGDVIHLFSNKQINELETAKPQPVVIESGSVDPAETEDNGTLDPLVATFLKERAAFIRGAVRKPGAYPITEGATLESLLAVAGGMTLEGNGQNVEVTSAMQGEGHQENGRTGTRRLTFDLASTQPNTVPLAAGDTVRVNQKFRKVEDNHVLLVGEVANPGTYDLVPGDTLGKLLARAGGVTPQGYPDGTIFSRESERKREEVRFRAQARDLEMKLASMLEENDDEKKPSDKEMGAAKDLIVQLKQADALGRITVESDPGVLEAKPDLDILLEPGDRIYIPKRPLTVRVAGEVLSPAALQFRTEKDPRDYIGEAGGYTYNADKDRTFVIYPDGSAQPLSVSAWNHSATLIPPGSTIVVPRDPKPFDFIDSAKDLTQIMANLATTAIFADEFGDDD